MRRGEIRAVHRTIDGHLAFPAAAHRAYPLPFCRTEPRGFAFLTDRAAHSHSIFACIRSKKRTWSIPWKPRSVWAEPTKRTPSTLKAWPYCHKTERFRSLGFREQRCATDTNPCALVALRGLRSALMRRVYARLQLAAHVAQRHPRAQQLPLVAQLPRRYPAFGQCPVAQQDPQPSDQNAQ